jgi:acetyl/propionyl-CoA carboxylase alpha subunit
MPGVVKKVQCGEGDSVAQGAIVVTLEAMKMQNPLFAPMTGIVKKIHVLENESIGEDEVILEFYEDSQDSSTSSSSA